MEYGDCEYSVQYCWGLLVAKWLKCWTLNSGCSLSSRIYFLSKVHVVSPTLQIEEKSFGQINCAVGIFLFIVLSSTNKIASNTYHLRKSLTESGVA